VTPSGKLADTWAVEYKDYPSSATFSHNNGNVDEEYYQEGIYVGYRYFDSFGVTPLYPFGYGLSYTSFDIKTVKVEQKSEFIVVSVKVRNTGDYYTGKEVV
jgi:beta-glucosidase